jgi:hypothetical protein
MGRQKRFSVFRAFWNELCETSDFSGRWVALDNVRYQNGSDEPLEADVVDVDDDLCELVNRMRSSDRTSCCVLQCRMRSPGVRAGARAHR